MAVVHCTDICGALDAIVTRPRTKWYMESGEARFCWIGLSMSITCCMLSPFLQREQLFTYTYVYTAAAAVLLMYTVCTEQCMERLDSVLLYRSVNVICMLCSPSFATFQRYWYLVPGRLLAAVLAIERRWFLSVVHCPLHGHRWCVVRLALVASEHDSPVNDRVPWRDSILLDRSVKVNRIHACSLAVICNGSNLQEICKELARNLRGTCTEPEPSVRYA